MEQRVRRAERNAQRLPSVIPEETIDRVPQQAEEWSTPYGQDQQYAVNDARTYHVPQQPQYAYQPYQQQPPPINVIVNNTSSAQNQNNINTAAVISPLPSFERSYFDGNLGGLFGRALLGALVTIITLGFGYPWAYCLVLRWKLRHTIIEGHRLDFIGTAGSLFGHWLLWVLLTIITLGIYSFFVYINMERWKTERTVFAS